MIRRAVFRPDVSGAEVLDWLKGGQQDFACHDPSCAPPPAGTGGSRRRTSGARILDITKRQGGATLNPKQRLRAVTSGFVVSERPEASYHKQLDQLTADDIDGWLKEHHKLLRQPGHNVGAWHDTETGEVWLDVVKVYPNTDAGRTRAIASGKRHNQIAIWHLDSMEEVRTGGTGEAVAAGLVASLVAACHSASCAPPPVGTGGSAHSVLSRKLARSPKRTRAARENTSVYPIDTHPVVKASDDHPTAPGTFNKAAVRAYKGQSGDQPERRIPRQGETVDIYRDLGKGKEHRRGFPDNDAFSVRLASSTSGNASTQVVASTVGIELSTPRPAWAHSSKAKVEADPQNRRGVHGFLRGEVQRYLTPEQAARAVSQPGWEVVTYYPGTQDFFLPATRQRVVGGDRAILHKGKFHMLNPQVVDGTPAPQSAIERGKSLAAAMLVGMKTRTPSSRLQSLSYLT